MCRSNKSKINPQNQPPCLSCVHLLKDQRAQKTALRADFSLNICHLLHMIMWVWNTAVHSLSFLPIVTRDSLLYTCCCILHGCGSPICAPNMCHASFQGRANTFNLPCILISRFGWIGFNIPFPLLSSFYLSPLGLFDPLGSLRELGVSLVCCGDL